MVSHDYLSKTIVNLTDQSGATGSAITYSRNRQLDDNDPVQTGEGTYAVDFNASYLRAYCSNHAAGLRVTGC